MYCSTLTDLPRAMLHTIIDGHGQRRQIASNVVMIAALQLTCRALYRVMREVDASDDPNWKPYPCLSSLAVGDDCGITNAYTPTANMAEAEERQRRRGVRIPWYDSPDSLYAVGKAGLWHRASKNMSVNFADPLFLEMRTYWPKNDPQRVAMPHNYASDGEPRLHELLFGYLRGNHEALFKRLWNVATEHTALHNVLANSLTLKAQMLTMALKRDMGWYVWEYHSAAASPEPWKHSYELRDALFAHNSSAYHPQDLPLKPRLLAGYFTRQQHDPARLLSTLQRTIREEKHSRRMELKKENYHRPHRMADAVLEEFEKRAKVLADTKRRQREREARQRKREAKLQSVDWVDSVTKQLFPEETLKRAREEDDSEEKDEPEAKRICLDLNSDAMII